MGLDAASQKTGGQSAVSDSASKTESLAIDHILEGRRETKKSDPLAVEDRKKSRQAPTLDHIPEQQDQLSQDSRVSRPIEEVVGGAKRQDPRKKNVLRSMEIEAQAKAKAQSQLNQANLQQLDAKARVNDQLFRQPEAVAKEGVRIFEFDKSLDRFFRHFCKALVEEAHSSPKPKEIEDFVDHYGRQSPGFLHYPEFKEIFQTHIQTQDPKSPPPEEGKLLALFNLFDVQSRGKVARSDFVMTVNRLKPAI
mmetsp:Transcript_42490/g.65149  ORF Transcript_42490/g.65149 Transcript_42490/m.65149 type:complete len:251 (-) Transcript_42490:7727-8479(-)